MYKALVGRHEAVPLIKSKTFNIDQDVVITALDGKPRARVTDLLKEDFASAEGK